MKAAVIEAPSSLSVKDVDDPERVESEALVRVLNCSICGSDLNIYPKDPPIPSFWPGHEICGVIEAPALGGRFPKGTVVAVKPVVHCGACRNCLAGRDNFCLEQSFIGIDRPGGFAEYVNVPERVLFALPDGISPEVGSLLEPLSCALHAIRTLEPGQNDRVLILGAGTQGLMTLLWLKKHFLHENVYISYRYPHQGRLASACGADVLVPEAEVDALERSSFQAVIEAVGGDGSSFTTAIELAEPCGGISLLGTCYANPSVNLKQITEKELVLHGSHRYTNQDFIDAAAAIADFGEILAKFITHSFPLDEIESGFEVGFHKKKEEAVKITINISER